MRWGGAPAVGRDRVVALGLFAVAVVALGLAEIAVLPTDGPVPFGLLVLVPLFGWVYAATGLLAWVRRPSNRMGPLLCAGGLMWIAAGAVNTVVPVFVAVGLVTMTVTIALAVHALLAFPSGRLPDLVSRGLVVSIYVVALVLQAPLYLYDGSQPPPFDVLLIADRPDLVVLGHDVQAYAGLVVLVAAGAVLARRLVVADRAHRRVLAPVYASGAVVVVGVTASVHLARLFGINPLVRGVLQLALLGALPVAFVAGVLLGGFARTGELEELGAWLGASGDRPSLRDALARTLGDPRLTLAFPVADGWVDAAGAAVELPAPSAGQGVVTVTREGRPVGAITYDAVLIADAASVRAAGRVVAIAVDYERLTAQLLASQEQLRDSRTRLVEAGDRERRRLAQDLHDRLQGRLTLLALRVGSARPGDDLTLIRRGLDETITELRWLVQGVMPSLLVERGLIAAVEDMADRLPIRTVVDLDGADRLDSARLPASVEGTAYHVVAEALTNAVKHAGANELTVAIGQQAGQLRILVADDGVGGAAPAGGAGLRGMADRVNALGGRLVIDSPPGAGTRLLVEMPCGS